MVACCVCVCMYVYIYECVCVYIYIYIYTCVYIYTCIYCTVHVVMVRKDFRPAARKPYTPYTSNIRKKGTLRHTTQTPTDSLHPGTLNTYQAEKSLLDP